MMTACGASEQELFDEGVKSLEAGDFPKAVGYFDRVIEKNESNTSAHNARGVAFFQQGKFDEAIVAFTNSIRIDSISYKPFCILRLKTVIRPGCHHCNTVILPVRA